MYRRPKFLEILLDIRREMALEADYDVDLFAELARSGKRSEKRSRPSAGDDLSTQEIDSMTAPRLRRAHGTIAKK